MIDMITLSFFSILMNIAIFLFHDATNISQSRKYKEKSNFSRLICSILTFLWIFFSWIELLCVCFFHIFFVFVSFANQILKFILSSVKREESFQPKVSHSLSLIPVIKSRATTALFFFHRSPSLQTFVRDATAATSAAPRPEPSSDSMISNCMCG